MCLKIDGVFPFLQRYIKQSVCNMFISHTVIALICSSSGFAEVNLSLKFIKFISACFCSLFLFALAHAIFA